MRLLDTYTGRFVEKDPRPPLTYWVSTFHWYAILSHTWDADGEQTYNELKKIQKRYAGECLFPAEKNPDGPSTTLSAIWQDRDLSPKIRDACRVAREYRYRYLWIDSCCIDKTSSSELSESINSMFLWYQWATTCFAYLADVPPILDEDPEADGSAFCGSRWFKRGWTLQELLAPESLLFLSNDWELLGTKEDLSDLVNSATGIDTDALLNKRALSHFSVAQRLSWASNRNTTRVEDRAYSLLGIFDINMPTLYGEGNRAFMRLQEEILRRIPDQSIFAFSDCPSEPEIVSVDSLNPEHELSFRDESKSLPHVFMTNLLVDKAHPHALLSSFPDNFLNARRVPLDILTYHYPKLPPFDYSFTPHGIRMHIPLIPLSAFPFNNPLGFEGEQSEWYMTVLGCEHADYPGYLLARVCRVSSSASGINVLVRGSMHTRVDFKAYKGDWKTFKLPSVKDSSNFFFALSVEVLERSSPSAVVLPVYLPQSNHQDDVTWFDGDIDHNSPHRTIHLMLKKNGPPRPSRSEEEPAPTLNLRRPDQDHPNTHRLTISRPASHGTGDVQDTITVDYQHTLENDGHKLTIYICTIGTFGGYAIGSPYDYHQPLINDHTSWDRMCKKRWIMLDNGNGGKVELELSLEFFATNYYLIDVHTTWFNKRPSLEHEENDTKEPVSSLEDPPEAAENHEYRTFRFRLLSGATKTRKAIKGIFRAGAHRIHMLIQ